MLRLEVGIALQPAYREAQTVMLAHVAIAAHTSRVLQEQSLIVLLGNDVDDTGYGIAAVQRTRRALHDFYLLDVVRVNHVQVVGATQIAMQAFAIYKDEYVGIAQSVHLYLRPHVALAESKRGREPAQDVLQRTAVIVFQHTTRYHLSLHGGILQQVLSTSTRDDDFL